MNVYLGLLLGLLCFAAGVSTRNFVYAVQELISLLRRRGGVA